MVSQHTRAFVPPRHQSSKERSSGWGVGLRKPTRLRRKNQNSRAKMQVVIRWFISSSWSQRGSRPDVEDLSLQADQQSSTYHALLATWRNDICWAPKISKFFHMDQIEQYPETCFCRPILVNNAHHKRTSKRESSTSGCRTISEMMSQRGSIQKRSQHSADRAL